MTEKQPSQNKNTQPVLVKPEGDNVLHGTSQIEVWQTDGVVKQNAYANGARRDGFHVTAYGEKSVTVIDPDGGPTTRYRQRQELTPREADLELDYQADLARELAGLPLRTDRIVGESPDGKLLEGTIDSYYTVEGKKYAALDDGQGSRIGMHLESLSPEAQAELKARHEIEERGEAVLEAAEVNEPSPWSKEVADKLREAALPSREKPRMFDDMKILPVSFTQGGGELFHGDQIGWFQEGGHQYDIVVPTAESRRRLGITDEQIAVLHNESYARTTAGDREAQAESVVEVVQPEPAPVVIEAPAEQDVSVEAQAEIDAVQAQIDAVQAQIDTLTAEFTESTKRGLWMMSNALHGYEETAARKYIQYGVTEDIIRQYKTLVTQRRALEAKLKTP